MQKTSRQNVTVFREKRNIIRYFHEERNLGNLPLQENVDRFKKYAHKKTISRLSAFVYEKLSSGFFPFRQELEHML